MRLSMISTPFRPMLLVAVLASCSAGPDITVRSSAEALRADYPALLPTDALRAAAEAPPRQQVTDQTAPAIDARAARLKARAAGLRGDVIDAAAKERLGSSIKIEDEDA